MANNDITLTKSKHIDIRYHFIGEVVNIKAMVILYYPMGDMLSYALTKFSFPTCLHLKSVAIMLIGTCSGPKKAPKKVPR